MTFLGRAAPLLALAPAASVVKPAITSRGTMLVARSAPTAPRRESTAAAAPAAAVDA